MNIENVIEKRKKAYDILDKEGVFSALNWILRNRLLKEHIPFMTNTINIGTLTLTEECDIDYHKYYWKYTYDGNVYIFTLYEHDISNYYALRCYYNNELLLVLKAYDYKTEIEVIENPNNDKLYLVL